MKYYLVTAQGETGPFTVEKVNRMFQKGEVRGEQLCRAENSKETQRLDAVFKHFAPSQAVAVKARREVANYNVSAGSGSVNTGVLMAGAATFALFASSHFLIWKIGFIIVGISLIVNGMSQQKRGL